MAHASSTKRTIERYHSYSEHYHSGCIKTLATDLSEFVAEFKNCLCHQHDTYSYCPLSKEKHRLLGRILEMLQEDACNLSTPARRNSELLRTREQSFDSSTLSGSHRTFLAGQSSSESTDNGYSSQSSQDSQSSQSSHGSQSSQSLVDGTCACSPDGEANFVIKKGYLLIINNVWFHGRCCPRNGTKAEGERMQALFESFGFYVHVAFNQTTEDFRQTMKDITSNSFMKNYDCFALLMLSHGTEDGIIGVDNKEISYREIMNMVKADRFPIMGGKPKLIFSQACRGITHDAGCLLGRGGSDARRDCGRHIPQTVLRVPTDSNILIVYATTPGRMAYKFTDFKSQSDSVARSWFLDALCQVFIAHADREDLLSMLTRVNNHVAIIGSEGSGMQIPSQFSTLTQKVYLSRRRDAHGH